MARFSIGRFAMRIDCPEQRAAMHLKRIVALTEARQVCDDTYFLKAGGKRFLLNDRAVRIISHGGGKSTCVFIPAHPNMPRQEVIASAWQQLKNNSCKSAAPSESAASSRLVFLVKRNVGGILPSPFSLLGPPSKPASASAKLKWTRRPFSRSLRLPCCSGRGKTDSRSRPLSLYAHKPVSGLRPILLFTPRHLPTWL